MTSQKPRPTSQDLVSAKQGTHCTELQIVKSKVNTMAYYTNKYILVRLIKRRRFLLHVTLAVTLLLLVVSYQEICRNVRGAIYMFQERMGVHNGTYLLTINMAQGQMGNKMFKYASLLGIAKREGRTPFVFQWDSDSDLESLFKLTHVEYLTNYWTNWWPSIAETDYAYYDPVFTNLSLSNLKLDGFVQSWKYFKNVEERVRQEFKLVDTLESQADRILNEIRRNSNDIGKALIVGVHVRRFNDVKEKNTTRSPKSFFVNSFEKMKSLLPGQRVIFVVAGDDLDWCKENLSGENVTILEPASPTVHFAVLSSCQHFIVSAGTFGWWAGWLTGGHVIFYKKFPTPEAYQAKGFHYKDYYPPSWIPVGD